MILPSASAETTVSRYLPLMPHRRKGTSQTWRGTQSQFRAKMQTNPNKPELPLLFKTDSPGLRLTWLRAIPDRPLSFFKGQLVALGAIAAAGLARWAALPLIGADVSFMTAIPAVLLATLMGGRAAGLTTLLAGSALDLSFSIGMGEGSFDRAIPRLVLWLCAAGFIMVVALNLRAALSALRARERDLIAAGERLQLVLHESEHRGRNALSIIRALANDAARSTNSVAEYHRLLVGRLSALSTSYTNLTRHVSEPVDLSELIHDVLALFGKRVQILDGPPCRMPETACVPLTLALHELATNAIKHGALSKRSGVVIVQWTLLADGLLDLRWNEQGGPRPKAVVTEGSGSQFLRRVFEGLPGGSFKAAPEPKGMDVQIRLATAPSEALRDTGTQIQAASLACSRSQPTHTSVARFWSRNAQLRDSTLP